MAKKIRIAFIKYGGLSAGGTEKFLQTIAANLDKERFSVEFFYCDASPYLGSEYTHPTTDPHRLKYLQEHGVTLKKFRVGAKDVRTRTHQWIDTDFWNMFKEENYDIVQTGRAGFPEYPFTKIRKTPIVDSLHLLAGVDNQYNISRVMHITRWSADKWIRMGGDARRVVLVSHPMEIDAVESVSMRSVYGIPEDAFVFGFHQRNDNNIFSPIPLEAYAKVQTKNTRFILMGGGKAYRDQAASLGLGSVIFIDHSAHMRQIYSFLKTLNVYTHGRKDGEVNSTAMAEAMYFGLPIVSHTSAINNGHIECIDNAGQVVGTAEHYAAEMRKLMNDKAYREYRRDESRKRFSEKYELRGQIANIERIYEDVVRDPFPHPFHRRIASLRLYYLFIYSWARAYRKIKRS